jgi:hypothetical protein
VRKVLSKAEQWLDRMQAERSRRRWDEFMMSASPNLREEYFAAVRGEH